MITNGVITIYNAEKSKNSTNLTAHFITPVSIHGSKSENANNHNISDADKYIVRIPQSANKQFIEYTSYSDNLQPNFYCVKKGDYCILNCVDKEICTLSELLDEYGGSVYKITSVTDNRSVLKYTSHIKLVIE